MPNVYMVSSKSGSVGTAGATSQGKYTDAQYATIGADAFANALSNDWASQGLGAATDYYYADVEEAVTAGATGGDRILGLTLRSQPQHSIYIHRNKL